MLEYWPSYSKLALKIDTSFRAFASGKDSDYPFLYRKFPERPLMATLPPQSASKTHSPSGLRGMPSMRFFGTRPVIARPER